jgi:hypothetical protein
MATPTRVRVCIAKDTHKSPILPSLDDVYAARRRVGGEGGEGTAHPPLNIPVFLMLWAEV